MLILNWFHNVYWCRFGTKSAIFTGAVYYTVNIGLWKDSANTEKLYGELYKTVAPYVKDVPVEVKTDISYTNICCFNVEIDQYLA